MIPRKGSLLRKVVAGSVEEFSNDTLPVSGDYQRLDDIFSELADWENQLQDVDFDHVEKQEIEAPSPKRGGPSPC